jgi:hypothetical protein
VVQEAKVLEGFEDLSRKCKRSKNAKRGEWEYSDLGRLCLGFQMVRKWTYIFCLSSFNQVVIWFCLRWIKCNILLICTSEMEGYDLPELGLEMSRKWLTCLLFVVCSLITNHDLF